MGKWDNVQKKAEDLFKYAATYTREPCQPRYLRKRFEIVLAAARTSPNEYIIIMILI